VVRGRRGAHLPRAATVTAPDRRRGDAGRTPTDAPARPGRRGRRRHRGL